MSLTFFLQIPAVKDLFKNEFPLERPKLTGEIKAIPVTKHYSLVGTAFDYLLRFFLEYKNPNCIAVPWVAEDALILLNKTVETNGGKTPDAMLDVLDRINIFLLKARKIHGEYLKNGNLDDDLIRTTIVLAQIDVIYRAGKIYSNFDQVDDGDVQDLRNLISLVNPDMFLAKKACYLNPTFGYGSALVSGADADLVIDDTLIDIKTIKLLSFTQNHYNQLIGYYILSKLGMINGLEETRISKIGIYFSRHGILHTISTDEIESNPGFPQFVRKFEELAIEKFGGVEEN